MDWQDVVLALSIVIAMATFMRASNASLRKELKGDIAKLQGDITELKEDVTEIKGRVERIEHHMAKREGFDAGVAYARTHIDTISE